MTAGIPTLSNNLVLDSSQDWDKSYFWVSCGISMCPLTVTMIRPLNGLDQTSDVNFALQQSLQLKFGFRVYQSSTATSVQYTAASSE